MDGWGERVLVRRVTTKPANCIINALPPPPSPPLLLLNYSRGFRESSLLTLSLARANSLVCRSPTDSVSVPPGPYHTRQSLAAYSNPASHPMSRRLSPQTGSSPADPLPAYPACPARSHRCPCCPCCSRSPLILAPRPGTPHSRERSPLMNLETLAAPPPARPTSPAARTPPAPSAAPSTQALPCYTGWTCDPAGSRADVSRGRRWTSARCGTAPPAARGSAPAPHGCRSIPSALARGSPARRRPAAAGPAASTARPPSPPCTSPAPSTQRRWRGEPPGRREGRSRACPLLAISSERTCRILPWCAFQSSSTYALAWNCTSPRRIFSVLLSCPSSGVSLMIFHCGWVRQTGQAV